MKAAVRRNYGPPDVLKIETVEKPLPKADEVLIKVHTTTVNRTDCAIVTGKPYIMRLFIGLFKPKNGIPGTDFAGEIASIGQNVTAFKIGDKVFGFGDEGIQSQAQYMTIPEKKAVATFPNKFTFDEAVASLEGAHYAYNFINKVKLIPGQKVLVNGATGAIGSAMVQILKYYGAYVTAVCNTKNVALIDSLGVDRTIDYKKEDFTKDHEKYDYVFDAVGKSTFGKCKRLLHKKGVYISSELGPGVQNPFLALVTPLFGGKSVKFPFPSNILQSINFIKGLIEEGKFKPIIDSTYPLEKISEAYTYVIKGEKTGNVILSMS
ncbi:NAD(P)-dependent alcohol dehydrogenase [Maribacter halichondriae]|uniref:NAD(P)-dependent alcohol dehydrogenase n=1 Tax=Maribacter halichondriae TaxID=2980554 RepID=UPI002359E326|nr:NAD(P)-dependent alcohol dehydrogenase [Maribacter sp. Hal144]